MLMITPSATNPKVTERGLWNVFRTCGRDDQQGKLWADYIADEVQGQEDRHRPRQDDLWPGPRRRRQGLHERRRHQGSALRRRQHGREGLFGARLQDQGVRRRHRLWGGLHTEGGLIVRQMRDQGLKTVMMSGDGITSDEFATIGGAGVDGTLMSFGPIRARTRPPRPSSTSSGQEASSREAYTLYTYAAVQIMAQAAEQAKSLDPKKVAEVHALRQGLQDRARRHLLRQEGRPSRRSTT